MVYISKAERRRWLDLPGLLQLIQADAKCTEDAARQQIRDALEDGAVSPLKWLPKPEPQGTRGGIAWIENDGSGHGQAPRHGSPHWQAVEIDWQKGAVFDDFDIEDPEPGYVPRESQWRRLLLDRATCERIWCHSPPASKTRPAASAPALRRRGRIPKKREAAKRAIKNAIRDGRYTLEQLQNGTIKLEALAAEFGFQRKTFTEALRGIGVEQPD